MAWLEAGTRWGDDGRKRETRSRSSPKFCLQTRDQENTSGVYSM
jgi:hypothetical protein